MKVHVYCHLKEQAANKSADTKNTSALTKTFDTFENVGMVVVAVENLRGKTHFPRINKSHKFTQRQDIILGVLPKCVFKAPQ